MRVLLTIFLFVLWNIGSTQNETWVSDIAPLIYENCTSCHHPGAIAPFTLMEYEDVVNYAELIHHVIEERSMPPWPADPSYRHFVGEAYLSQEDIDKIHRWIDEEMPYGYPSITVEQPTYPPQGSSLEYIDFTVAIEPYTLQSDIDEYRWFVIENPFDEAVYISKIEVFAGLDNVVHHADLFIDGSGNSLANDLADPLPGFNNNTGFATNEQYINAWQPGANTISYPEEWGFRIPPDSDFVVEIHYGPGGLGQVDSTFMNLQFLSNPENAREVKAAWLMNDSGLIDGPLDIPANEIVSFHQETAPLAQDISAIAICPHMHLLGKSYRVWFESPEGDSIPLINIDRWDFHWQKYYGFQHIQHIPAGSVLKSEGVYDNTTANHDNPNDPPVDVTGGNLTEDEMFLCYFIYADYSNGDEDILMDSTLLMSSTTNFKPPSSHILFPNPARNVISLSLEKDTTRPLYFSIRNTAGLIMDSVSSSKSQISFPIWHLPNGVYFLEWKDGTFNYSEKFVKIE